jgi:signal transduction histidine kinase
VQGLKLGLLENLEANMVSLHLTFHKKSAQMAPSAQKLPNCIKDRELFGLKLKVFLFSLLGGALVWISDAILDSFYFYKDYGSFLDILYLRMPQHETYIRSVVLFIFLLFGFVISKVLVKQKRTERELRRLYDELENRVKERTDALSRHAERLRILHSIARDILELRSPEETAHGALAGMLSLFPFDWASVSSINNDSCDDTSLIAFVGSRFTPEDTPRKVSLLMNEAIAGAFKQGQHYSIKDTLESGQELREARALMDEGIRSFVTFPLSFQTEVIGALNMSALTPDAFTPEHIDVAHEIASILAIAVQNAGLLSSTIQQHKSLRALSARLADAEGAERRRLSRELHDRVGQNLSALNINLTILGDLVPGNLHGHAMERIKDSLALVDETMACIRDIMADLRPPLLDDYGLPTALRRYVAEFSKRTGVDGAVHVAGFSSRLPASVETALFRIAQEALTNVTRHAKATKVCLTLEQMNGTAHLKITDNGIGFSRLAIRDPRRQHSGWGLMGMRERAEAVGGKLVLRTASGKGTEIVVEVGRKQQ